LSGQLLLDTANRLPASLKCPSKHKNDFWKYWLWRLLLTVCDAIPS